MNQNRMRIGIIGGMGPQAGFDLASKLTSETVVESDQDHHSVIVLSFPGDVPDRTRFLSGETSVNPAEPLTEQLVFLEQSGVAVAAMACNTAHAPPIFDSLLEAIAERGMKLRLLNLIDETVAYIRRVYPDVTRVGILGTPATHKYHLYDNAIERAGLTPLVPDQRVRDECVFRAIYDPAFGIKVHSDPVSKEAREHVGRAIVHLNELGAEAIILGCTELPLAFSGELPDSGENYAELNPTALHSSSGSTPGAVLIDPARAIAQALIRFTQAHAQPSR